MIDSPDPLTILPRQAYQSGELARALATSSDCPNVAAIRREHLDRGGLGVRNVDAAKFINCH
jgi:hypothetical protein